MFERMIPSEVEQKLRVPVFFETGAAVTTYSEHEFSLQIPFKLKR
jgi:hypothetical protein